MNQIIAVEDAIIAIATNALKDKVRPMETLPGRMSLQVLDKISANAPAVYVTYLGGRKNAIDSDASHNGIFAVYIITEHINNDDAGRRGDKRTMGAYDIINILIPLINEHTVDGVGLIKFQSVENLFSVELDKQGVSIYAAVFEVPMSFEYRVDETTLNDFVTYQATHSISPDADVPTSEDTVTLEQ